MRCGSVLRAVATKAPTPAGAHVGSRRTSCQSPSVPAEAAGRAVPGQWEGNLVLGRSGKSYTVAIVERTNGFTLHVPLPADSKAHTVRDAIASKIVELTEYLRRSLT